MLDEGDSQNPSKHPPFRGWPTKGEGRVSEWVMDWMHFRADRISTWVFPCNSYPNTVRADELF